jgi:hypothetical protein
MRLTTLKLNPSSRDLRQFAGILLPLFLAFGGAFVGRRSGAWTAVFAVWGLGGIFCLAGVLRPTLARPLFVGWMRAAYPIGWAVSNALVIAVYWFVITPIGTIMRMLGKDPLEPSRDRSAGTYWVEHDPAEHRSRYFRQF